MRKYWKTLALIGFLLVVLILFYVRAGSYTDRLPQFTFHKLEGDEAAVEPFIIRGAANYTMLETEFFEVKNDGTTYMRDEPFFKKLGSYGFYSDVKEEERVKQYRSFMRGKWEMEAYFDEDDEILAYAAADDNLFSFSTNEFSIDVLEKQTGERTTFQLPIPEHDAYWYLDVMGVKVIDDQMYLFVEASGDSEDGGKEENFIHQYTIDLKSEQMTEEQQIAAVTSENDENGYEELRILFNEGGDDLSFLVVHDKTSYGVNDMDPLETDEQSMEESHSTIESIQLHHMTKGKQKSISTKALEGYPIAWMDGHVYLAEFSKEQLKMIDYDVEQEKVTASEDIDMKSDIPLAGDELEYQGEVVNGKWYITNFQDGMSLANAAVIDLKGLQADYLGELEMTISDNDEQRAKMYLENMYFDSVDVQGNK